MSQFHDSRYERLCQHGWYFYVDGCPACNAAETTELMRHYRDEPHLVTFFTRLDGVEYPFRETPCY